MSFLYIFLLTAELQNIHFKMKTKVLDKKGKKRSISETSTFIKSNQKQENVDELKKSFKKAKFGIKQNGNPTVGEKAPVSKVMDKQKKEQNKIVKQQSSIVKPSETKKEKTELTVVKSKKETDGKIHRGNKTPSMIVKNFTEEQVTKKIAEIKSREMLSKRAKRLLGALKNKLREYENNSEKLDTVDKKSNRKKVEQPANTLKKTNEIKTKAEKKLVTRKDEPQEEDDSDNELEEEEDSDIEEESEEEESDESEAENELIGSLSNKKEEVDDESDEDEEDEEEIESEEDEEEESEDIDDEEGIESEEDEEDEEANEDEEDEDDEEDEEDEEDEKNIIKKSDFLELKKKEVQNKNKQRQNKNKQEQNKNKPEQNKNKQVPQFSDNEQKGEMNKKRYVLFVGNLPLE